MTGSLLLMKLMYLTRIASFQALAGRVRSHMNLIRRYTTLSQHL